MLTTVKIINDLFSMNNCFLKAPQSKEKIKKFASRSFVNFDPGVIVH
jgi:hypothetical protein